MHAGFHNHAGAGIGGAIWDGWEFLKPLDPRDVGFYFDPSHASIEGARHTWKLNLQRISSRVTMIALKDYVWEKSSNGWQTRWCPLGDGLVNWREFFQMLSRTPFAGPMSLHIEYNPGGSTRPERIDNASANSSTSISRSDAATSECTDRRQRWSQGWYDRSATTDTNPVSLDIYPWLQLHSRFDTGSQRTAL